MCRGRRGLHRYCRRPLPWKHHLDNGTARIHRAHLHLCRHSTRMPLSGLIFNIAIDPVVRAVQGGGARHAILAYADDLTPLADDPGTLQSRITTVSTLAARIGLHLNPTKCRTMHLSGKTPVGLRPTTFHIDGTPIPHVTDYDSHTFLGAQWASASSPLKPALTKPLTLEREYSLLC